MFKCCSLFLFLPFLHFIDGSLSSQYSWEPSATQPCTFCNSVLLLDIKGLIKQNKQYKTPKEDCEGCASVFWVLLQPEWKISHFLILFQASLQLSLNFLKVTAFIEYIDFIFTSHCVFERQTIAS